MTFLLASLGGIAGALAGFVALGTIAYLLSGPSGSADAAAGKLMVAVFSIAPFGALLGLVLGTWYVLHLRGVPSFPRALGYSAAVLAVAGAITFLTVYVLLETNPILRPNQATLQLEFEIRLPPGTAAPEPLKAVKVDLRTDHNTMPGALIPSMTRKDGERVVLGGRVEVYFRTSNRALALMIPSQPERYFPLKLPARPPLSDTYSGWQPAFASQARSGVSEDFDIRYRMVDPVVSRPPQ
jgi:MFS family permease